MIRCEVSAVKRRPTVQPVFSVSNRILYMLCLLCGKRIDSVAGKCMCLQPQNHKGV